MSRQDEGLSKPVAVIGWAGRFPGADDVGEFWNNLLGGLESISFYSEDELRSAGIAESSIEDPDYIRANPAIDGAELFDAGYFGVGAREAAVIDPQQRILLEVAADALGHAGYDPRRFSGPIGMFAGAAANEYYPENVAVTPGVLEATGSLVGKLSNDTDYVATSIAYRLNLRGPAVTMVTACSTSLVTMHYACRSLQLGECEMALAGGVEIRLPLVAGYPYSPGSIFSADGRVRAFDAAANGTVFGAGAGLVLLKPLAAAIADGDTIITVIRGSAVNNDGSDKSAFSAPSPGGQRRAIKSALSDAGVDPATIGYVEAHGTGTSVGDPLELEALSTAYGGAMGRPGRCAISSVKSNVGHLGAAAGVTGFIKAAQCLRTGLLPPVINVDTPNPALDLESGMFRINTELEEWGPVPGAGVRRAGVSSFGIGGTNAHLILEEPPKPAPSSPPARRLQLLPLSARTRPALDEVAGRLGAELASHPQLALADVAYTLSTGRTMHDVRRALVCADTSAARELCGAAGRLPSEQAASDRWATLLFPGQGAQYPGMGRGLYDSDPVFRAVVTQCADHLRERHGLDLLDLLFSVADGAAERLARTEFTQPAVFVVEYAMTRALQSWGVEIADMAGHSIGEYVAACVAGVFSLTDALDLVVDRGRLMQALPTGSMLAVPLPEDLLRPLLPPTLDIAAVNSPELTVVAGPDDEIKLFAELVGSLGAVPRPVRTSHAFHSQMMEPILDQFRSRVAEVELRAPTLPFVSNVTGTWITDEEATDPNYWARHLRSCVRFSDALTMLAPRPDRLLFEVGPGRTLTTFAASVAAEPAAAAISTMRVAQQTKDDLEVALGALGSYWTRGGVVDWTRHFAAEKRRRVPLPAYPYDRSRYWIDPPARTAAAVAAAPLADTSPFSVPTWNQVASMPLGEVEYEDLTGRIYLVLAPAAAAQLDEAIDRLRAAGARVLVARAGSAFDSGVDHQGATGDSWTVRPGEPEDLVEVVRAAAAVARGLRADHVRLVHGWTLGSRPSAISEAAYAPQWVELGFISALVLLQQAARHLDGIPHDLTVVSSGLHQVTGGCVTDPAKSGLVGLLRTAVKEFEGLTAVRGLDLDDQSDSRERDRRRETDQLLACLITPTTDEDNPYGSFVAIRGGLPWRLSGSELRLDAEDGVPELLIDRGVYLITGGLGGLGLALAEYLGRLVGARVVLMGRTELPIRETWPDLVADAAPKDPTVAKITGIGAAETAGAEVLVVSADVVDRESLVRARQVITQHFGSVDGIFHLAALAGGSMLETRDLDQARAVFRPKVEGAYLLEELFEPTLMVLYSSIAAVSGDFGLGDYSAANAVLDAFAQSRWAGGGDVISINMPPWEEVGMAFSIDAPVELGELSKGEVVEVLDHPLLTRKVTRDKGRYSFGINLSHHGWVMSDHLMSNIPTMPGTGIIELIRAAVQEASGRPQLEITDLLIARPLMAEPRVSARLELDPRDGGAYLATIVGGEDIASTVEYARATVRPQQDLRAPVEDLVAIRAGCLESVDPREIVKIDQTSGVLRFGPHWNNLVSVVRSPTTELVESRLPAELQVDRERFGLNPAQLDICVAVGQTLVPDGGYLPFGYEKIVVYGAMPERCFSVIRHRPDLVPGQFSSDIVVTDEDGRAVVAVDRLTMILVNDESGALLSAANAGLAVPVRDPIDVSDLLEVDGGVLTVEGLEGLRRILLTDPGPQVIWSAEGIHRRVDASGRVDRAAVVAASVTTTAPSSGGQRPLTTAMVPPSTPSEAAVCELWQDSLGIDQIGIDDDFFDLGGNSLTAVQLVSRISDRFHSRLAVFELFDARTPRVLAELIDNKLLEQVMAMSEDEAALVLAQLDANS